jgi:hypothetical protein
MKSPTPQIAIVKMSVVVTPCFLALGPAGFNQS